MTGKDTMTCSKVTVVVAVKNAATTISRCLESIQSQSVNLSGDLHLTIYDALSTDGTSDIIESFTAENAFPHLSYLRETDTGLYNAWNKGIQSANSEYLFYLNADDYFHREDVLQEMVELADKSNSALVSGYTQMVNPVGRASFGGGGGNLWSMCWKMTFVTPATLFRLACLREIGGFSYDWRVSSDYDMMIRMLKTYAGRITVFNRSVVNFSTDGISNSTMRDVGFAEARRVIQNHFGLRGLIIRRTFEVQEGIKRLIYRLVV